MTESDPVLQVNLYKLQNLRFPPLSNLAYTPIVSNISEYCSLNQFFPDFLLAQISIEQVRIQCLLKSFLVY
jgi:hypothetical protein